MLQFKRKRRYTPGPPWEDTRRPDVPYLFRYELPNPCHSLTYMRDTAYALRSAISFLPICYFSATLYKEGAPLPEEHDLCKRATAMLGVRVHPYALSKSPEPHLPTAIVHGWKDMDVYYEDYLNSRKREFAVAHELGHMILHSSKGKQPVVFPRLSGGAHDREAVVFAGYLCLPNDEMAELETLMGRSVLAMAANISKRYYNSRYLPPGPNTTGGGNKRKRTRQKKFIRKSRYRED